MHGYHIEWVPSLEPSACPSCGDTLARYELWVQDHGKSYPIYLYWCPDCRVVRIILVPEPWSLDGAEPRPSLPGATVKVYDAQSLKYKICLLDIVDGENG